MPYHQLAALGAVTPNPFGSALLNSGMFAVLVQFVWAGVKAGTQTLSGLGLVVSRWTLVLVVWKQMGQPKDFMIWYDFSIAKLQ